MTDHSNSYAMQGSSSLPHVESSTIGAGAQPCSTGLVLNEDQSTHSLGSFSALQKENNINTSPNRSGTTAPNPSLSRRLNKTQYQIPILTQPSGLSSHISMNPGNPSHTTNPAPNPHLLNPNKSSSESPNDSTSSVPVPVVQIQRAPAIRRKPGRTAPIQANLLYPREPEITAVMQPHQHSVPASSSLPRSFRALDGKSELVATPASSVSPQNSLMASSSMDVSVSDSACITTPAQRKPPTRHDISIDVTEFISFAVFKLWTRFPGRQPPRRLHTVNVIPTDSDENSPRGTVYSRKTSPSSDQNASPALSSSSTNTKSSKIPITRSFSAREVNANDLPHLEYSKPTATPMEMDAQQEQPEQPVNAQPQEAMNPAQPPFDSLVCPAGTSHWYPQYVESVHHLLCQSGVSMPHILIALLYIARLRRNSIQSASSQQPSQGGIEYRILLIALILAQKFHSDDRYKNSVWATIAKLPTADVDTMEREFLGEIRWQLHVNDSEYTKWSQTIQALGQEHALVLKATMMHETELSRLKSRINRPDLVAEIEQIRRARTLPRHLG